MKKFILTESQIKYLKEYINQLQIPFNEFGDENGKENYDYYLDFIENVGKYGELPPSTITKQELVHKLNDRIFTIFDNFSSLELVKFINQNQQYYLGDINEINHLMSNQLLNQISDEGLTKLVNQTFNTEKFVDSLTFNEKGLIYVERVISVNFPLKERPSKKTFTYFNHQFRHFGKYWTWKKGGGETFSKSIYYKEKQNSFIFKGFVDPKSIDIDGTLRANGVYPDEHELTLHWCEPIQINEIIWLEEYKKLPLHQPIIVQT